MLTIKSYERSEGAHGTQLTVRSDEFMGGGMGDIPYLLIDGVLETYIDAYGYPPGVCLSVMLLDAFYDDIEAPHSGDAGAAFKFLRIAGLAEERMVFECDRDALLAAVTLAEDDAASVAGTWAASRAATEEAAAGYRRRKEEMLGDAIVSDMQVTRRDQPGMKHGIAHVDSLQSRNGSGAFRVEW